MHAFDVIAPGAQLHAPVLEGHRHARRLFLQEVFDPPGHRLFGLGPILSQSLREVPVAIEQRHSDHRQFDVRRGPDRIPCQNAEPAAVARHGVLQCNLHRKVRNNALRGATLLHHVPRHPVEITTPSPPERPPQENRLTQAPSLSEINLRGASKRPQKGPRYLRDTPRKTAPLCYILTQPLSDLRFS